MSRSWYYSNENQDPVPSDDAGENPIESFERQWYYDEELPLDFEQLYRSNEGTILYRSDCGSEACGYASCCRSTGPENYIFFLPGEIEFHRSMKPGIPFQQVAPGFSDRLHCNGNTGCIYDKRPLDCRSYPYFPAVIESRHIGYFDCRLSHGCPLNPLVELRLHLARIHIWWSELLKRKDVLVWAEEVGHRLRNLPMVPLPI